MPLFGSKNSSKRKVKVDEDRIEEACRDLHGDDEEKVQSCIVERTERLKRY